jgi:hypothetical protein
MVKVWKRAKIKLVGNESHYSEPIGYYKLGILLANQFSITAIIFAI